MGCPEASGHRTAHGHEDRTVDLPRATLALTPAHTDLSARPGRGIFSCAVARVPLSRTTPGRGAAAAAENQDTFNPVSYGQACSGLPQRTGGGCSIVTEGYLSKSGADVTWGSQVPLGQPFSVRDPLWTWGTGRKLTSGDGSAIPTIVAGLFFDGVTLLLLYVLVVIVRHTSSRRSQRMVVRDTSSRRSQRRSVPGGADPGGVRRTHHPDGGNNGSGVRRHPRRGRGRR